MSGASARIRASIEALPSWARGEWDHHDQDEHAAEVTTSPLATAVARSDLTGGFARPVAAYIALMDPHVGQAVADLLDAEKLCREIDAALDSLTDDTEAHVFADFGNALSRAEEARRAAFDALEAAIEGGGQR